MPTIKLKVRRQIVSYEEAVVEVEAPKAVQAIAKMEWDLNQAQTHRALAKLGLKFAKGDLPKVDYTVNALDSRGRRIDVAPESIQKALVNIAMAAAAKVEPKQAALKKAPAAKATKKRAAPKKPMARKRLAAMPAQGSA
jgi:mannose/cellobiose epimerase-like protein (N-acyl-D-glucosamine 2-epimerase family)